MFARQLQVRLEAFRPVHDRAGVGIPFRRRSWRDAARVPLRKLRGLDAFVRRMSGYNRYAVRQCWRHLNYLRAAGAVDVVLYGDGDVVGILLALAAGAGVRVRAVCPFEPELRPCLVGTDVWNFGRLAAWEGKVLVATLTNVAPRAEALYRQGLRRDQVVVMR
jgi:hypothetical protein